MADEIIAVVRQHDGRVPAQPAPVSQDIRSLRDDARISLRPGNAEDANAGPQPAFMINRQWFVALQRTIKVTALRSAVGVADDNDVWRINPGGPDEKLSDGDVTVRNGERFFTTPRVINPGEPAPVAQGEAWNDAMTEIVALLTKYDVTYNQCTAMGTLVVQGALAREIHAHHERRAAQQREREAERLRELREYVIQAVGMLGTAANDAATPSAGHALRAMANSLYDALAKHEQETT